MRPVSLALYALLTGLALGLAHFVWHVWSDNAYLYAYFIALILLLTGSIAALVALSRLWGVPKAIATVVLAAVASLALFGPIGLSEVLAGPVVAGGNGSQSPCLAEARQRRPAVVPEEPPGYRPPNATQLEASERASLSGAVSQFLVPFLSGLVPLTLAVRSGRPGRPVLLRGLAPAAAVSAYVYLRGPGAWCGQLIGLDGLVAVVLGALFALSKLKLPARFDRRQRAT